MGPPVQFFNFQYISVFVFRKAAPLHRRASLSGLHEELKVDASVDQTYM